MAERQPIFINTKTIGETKYTISVLPFEGVDEKFYMAFDVKPGQGFVSHNDVSMAVRAECLFYGKWDGKHSGLECPLFLSKECSGASDEFVPFNIEDPHDREAVATDISLDELKKHARCLQSE